MKYLLNFLKKFHIIELFFVCLIQIPLILPFFHTGFFPSHDNVQVVRIFEMFQSLKYGGFPPRWQSGLLYGHGYPLYVFYSPFIYYLGSLFVFLGFNFLIATKIVFILSFLIGAIGMYFLLKMLFKNSLISFFGVILYSLAPYRATDVYVRGSLAEFFAFSLFPLIIFVNLKILIHKDKRFLPVLTLLLTILLTSHNISAFILAFFLVVLNLFFLITKFDKKIFKSLFFSVFLSIGLSAFYLLPVIVEQKYVSLSKFSQYPYQIFFLSLQQIWSMPWGFGGFTEINPMSLQLGKVLIILFVTTTIINQLIKTKLKYFLNFLITILVFTTFLETKYSLLIWQEIKILHYFQFPWRLHTLSTTIISILATASIFILSKRFKTKKLQILLIIFFSYIVLKENYSYFRPQKYTDDPAVSETTTWDDEYMPIWVATKPKEYSGNKIISLNNEDKNIFKNILWGYYTKSFEIETNQPSYIQIAHVYYPGWNAYVDGQKTEIYYNNPHGFMEINSDKGNHQIVFKFEKTQWRYLSEVISLVSLLVLICYSFITFKPKKL